MIKISRNEQKVFNVFKGVVRKTLACGKDVLMARFEYEKDSKVPPHKHSYEQVTTLLKGKQKVIVNGEGIIVEEGESYVVPANYEHEQLSLEETVTIDAWSMAP
ncbi:MAG: cupin domain-containing protein [Candidatus Aminicenantales bacterium]